MERRAKRISLPAVVRAVVLKRDRNRCRRCNSTANLHIDHIIPLAQGGTNDLSNLQALCRTCNLQKSSKRDPTFKRRSR